MYANVEFGTTRGVNR